MSVRPSKKTFLAVFNRDEGRCAWCSKAVRGERGEDYSLHHRRPAGMGGDRRPETHAEGNLILLCGSGCTACHGVVESSRVIAREQGFLIPRNASSLPSSFPIKHAVHGWVLLLDDGSFVGLSVPS